MDNYIILLYSFIKDNISNCSNKNKYEYDKISSFLFIDLYNDIINEHIYFDNYNKAISKLNCQPIDFKKIKNYKLYKIKVGKKPESNVVKYKYKIKFIVNNIKKSIYITSEILKTNSIFKFNKKIDKILLLYTIIGLNTGLFWGIHPSLYHYIENIEEKSIECFASPFNHSLKNYYSLLEIDTKFNSKGNFFKNFIDSKYNVYLMNPPFTSEIISRVFIEIEKKLEIDECHIYLYIPKWDDINVPFYNKMKDKFSIWQYNLLYGKSHIYDYMNQINIINKFNLTIFYITNKFNQKYYDIYKEFIKQSLL